MRQFVLPDAWPGKGPCVIDGGPARYLIRVLRLAPGDSFMGLEETGRRRPCTVLEATGDHLVLEVGEVLEGGEALTLEDSHGSRGRGPAKSPAQGHEEVPEGLGRIPLPRIILVQGIAKGPAMDLVVRQAAETGVSRLIPLEARRSVVKAREARGRGDRWDRILTEGLQQSGSPIATRLEAPCPAEGLLESLGPPQGRRLGLYLHEAPLVQTSLHEYLSSAPEEIVLCVGPEGGFAPDELAIFEKAGFRPLLLPGAILRAETAALWAVASVEIILSERSKWIPSP